MSTFALRYLHQTAFAALIGIGIAASATIAHADDGKDQMSWYKETPTSSSASSKDSVKPAAPAADMKGVEGKSGATKSRQSSERYPFGVGEYGRLYTRDGIQISAP